MHADSLSDLSKHVKHASAGSVDIQRFWTVPDGSQTGASQLWTLQCLHYHPGSAWRNTTLEDFAKRFCSSQFVLSMLTVPGDMLCPADDIVMTTAPGCSRGGSMVVKLYAQRPKARRQPKVYRASVHHIYPFVHHRC